MRGQFVNQVNKTVASARGWLPCRCEVVATITRRQKSLILIRAREVATNLSVPVSLLDAEGNLAKIMRRVKPEAHADDVLAALG